MSGLLGAGGLNRLLIDLVLQEFSTSAASLEIPLDIALIVVFLGLGITLAVVEDEHIRPVLMVSLTVSVIIWYVWQACGGILTGMATDFNSGLLLVVIAWASFLRSARSSKARVRVALFMRQAPVAGLLQRPAEVKLAGKS